MLTALLLALADPPAGKCAYDRSAMLALDQNAFDQDMKGGWRRLADAGCDEAASDLLRDYRIEHPGLSLNSILYWHEGQMRAFAGQYARAIPLFDQSRHTGNDPWCWNLYVDGGIAFLKHDRAGLQTARDKLAVWPRPSGFTEDQVDPTGEKFKVIWPPNLDVLDAFLRCFTASYGQAYACPQR